VIASCEALLRLRYAALDFGMDAAGRWWFLEINPNGQFLWIEQETGVPIAASVAAALHGRRRMSRPVLVGGRG
jgi:D-alanine-D-alanine ligase-like ATP-grasp enzyme